jgi:DNA-binding transcriptional MerR regulator
MPKTDFSSTAVARLAGVSYQALDRWLDAAIITCDVPAEGTGSRRRFTERDIAFVILARDLQAFGLRLATVQRCVAGLRAAWSAGAPEPAGYFVVTSAQAVTGVWLPDAGRLAEYVGAAGDAGQGLLLVIDVGALLRRVGTVIAAERACKET